MHKYVRKWVFQSKNKPKYFRNQLKDRINSFVAAVNLPSVKENFKYCIDCIYEIKFAKFRISKVVTLVNNFINDISAMDNNKEIRQKILKAKLFVSVHIFKAMLPILTTFNIFRFLNCLIYLLVTLGFGKITKVVGTVTAIHINKLLKNYLILKSILEDFIPII